MTRGLIVALLAAALVLPAPAEAYLLFTVRNLSGTVVTLRWRQTPVRYFVTQRGGPGVTAAQFASAIDASFRTVAKPQSRAMAGLSMGGAHTIRNGLTHPEVFRYVGIFSMGLGLGGNQAEVADYEKQNAAALARSAKELKLVYYAIGKEDFLYGVAAPTRAMLDRQGIHHIYNESGGGHTWINWRRYLNDFLPRLF